MTKMNIKKGDTAVVIVGKDKGRIAEVMECYPKQNKVMLKGINIIVKHNKPKSAQDKGGIVKKEGTIEACNVMLVCPVCNKATRVKMGLDAKGKKVRICKKCGAVIDSGVKKTVEKKPATPKQDEIPAEKVETKEVETVKAPVKKATSTRVAPKATKAHETKSAVKTTRVTTVRKSASTAKKIGGK
jgi:large subunit ribosomal protein L24